MSQNNPLLPFEQADFQPEVATGGCDISSLVYFMS
jgi:hypothetical protein